MEKLSFVWLESLADKSQKNVEIKSFQALIENLMFFENENQFTKYIEDMVEDDRIVFIINGQLVDKILPQIHEQSQILSIYIYCSNEEKYGEWVNKCKKIRGIFTRLNELMGKVLSDYSKQHNENTDESISFDIFNGHSTNELNGEFIHSQLLIDCLTRLQRNQDEKNEFITFYQQYNKKDKMSLTKLEEFLNEYLTKSALCWYTIGTGISRILNEALRNKEIDLLYYLRFFLRDIKHELENMKYRSVELVYRCQRISCDEIKKLQTAVGQLISVNTFFSTSRNSEVARIFDGTGFSEDNLENVLFHINVDSHSHKPRLFADITKISSKQDEEEILFMAGSIFRIESIDRHTEPRVIKMTLCSHDDEQFKSLTNYMINEYKSDEMNLFFFGNVLLGMDRLHDAKKYYRRFLDEVSGDHHDRAGCYHSLGMIEEENGNYEQSLKDFKTSLEMDERSLSNMNHSKNHPNIALSYNSIAVVYKKKGDYHEALESFNKALTIFKLASGEDCLDVGGCYYNIGDVYQTMERYSEAHDYYKKALNIRQKHPPENRLDIGQSLCSLGNIHLLLNELDSALEKYYCALHIYKKSCPGQHIDIAIAFENIGLVHEQKGDRQQSLAYLQKAKSIYINMSLHKHPTMKKIEDSIARVESKLNM